MSFERVSLVRMKHRLCPSAFPEASSRGARRISLSARKEDMTHSLRRERGHLPLRSQSLLPHTPRPRRRVVRPLRFAVLVLGASSLLPSTLASECIVTDDCRVCTSSDKDQIEQCAETGKVEYVTCAVSQRANDDDAQSK
jgi:hypothetical protein